MQGLILAAGFGSRLQPLTNTMPKSLTEINGRPLLINALTLLAKNGVDETVIVVGHMKDKIMETIGNDFAGMKITYVENELYRSTNNVYSFYLAKDYIRDDTVMLECDLFFCDDLIKCIMSSNADCGILVSPYNRKTMNGTVIEAENGRAKRLIIKRDQNDGFDYTNMLKTVNVYKFKRDFLLDKLFPAVELYVRTQSVNSYYELVLGSLIYYGNQDIETVEIDESRWAEVDDADDLAAAEEKFRSRMDS
ncbi:MAG: phosphocholine cytidylyltransferase family protein [Clostridia bacterium]|nr:phosphocholine cytidylyltransferase family protein [Clostridia bacterium]